MVQQISPAFFCEFFDIRVKRKITRALNVKKINFIEPILFVRLHTHAHVCHDVTISSTVKRNNNNRKKSNEKYR